MKLITKQVDNKPLTVTIEYPKLDERTEKLIEKVKFFNVTIVCKKDEKIYKLNFSDVYYIESVDRKTFLYLKNEVYITNKKLYELEYDLKGTGIIRISKSCLLNTDMLCRIRQLMNSQLEVILINGEKLIVARTYLKNIKNVLKGEA